MGQKETWTKQIERRIAKAKILAEQEKASVFMMLRILAKHPEGLTEEELWREIVEFSRRDGVNAITVLLVGLNGRLPDFLQIRVGLGHVDFDGAILRNQRRIWLTEEGKKFLEDFREEADRLIQKHVHAQLVL